MFLFSFYVIPLISQYKKTKKEKKKAERLSYNFYKMEEAKLQILKDKGVLEKIWCKTREI